MTDFTNTRLAFSIKTDRELRSAYYLFKIISFPWLVKVGNRIVMFASRIGLPVNWIVKPTVYKQFVGGETIGECSVVVERLAVKNVKTILDYSVEGSEEDEDIERVLEETLLTIDFAHQNPNVPFAVFKPTAFIKSIALEILSKDENPYEDIINEGKKFRERVERLCSKAAINNIPIMIDAEDSFYQPFIDLVVYEMQLKFNRKSAIVYNTYQMYRRDRLEVLQNDLKRAEEEGFFLGAKFVRGAYMERERLRAEKLSYSDPIHPDKESTDTAFNDALEYSINHIDRISIFNGTHNEYSSNWLTELMERNGIARNDKRIWFSQLYGMSDHITFNLAHEGYNAAKYLPYGPVKHVLPYLSRRVEENSSVKGQTGRELKLITEEFRRRRR